MNALYPEFAPITKRTIAWCIDKAVLLILILVINIFFVKHMDISLLQHKMTFNMTTTTPFIPTSDGMMRSTYSMKHTIDSKILTWILLDYLYYILAIFLSNQATIGQYLMNIRVVRLDGIKIEAKLAFIRNLSYYFPYFPALIGISIFFVYIIALGGSLSLFRFIPTYILIIKSILWITGLIIIPYWYLMAIFSDKKQTMSDKLCNVIVVSNTRAQLIPKRTDHHLDKIRSS